LDSGEGKSGGMSEFFYINGIDLFDFDCKIHLSNFTNQPLPSASKDYQVQWKDK
jgi:hypothetical protein